LALKVRAAEVAGFSQMKALPTGNQPVIVAASRSAIARVGRGLATLSLAELGSAVVAAAIERSGFDLNEVDSLVLGEVLQGGGCTARYIASSMEAAKQVSGLAVQQQCASGMAALQVGAAEIASNMASVVVAGGVESMTRMPRMHEVTAEGVSADPFIPPSHPDRPDAPNMNMLITVGENSARQCGVTRQESDEWSYHSHMRAVAAASEGRFAEEIVPLIVPDGTGGLRVFDKDEHPRPDTTLEKLALLPVLTGPGGQVTAGSSSGIADGAAVVVMTSRARADAAGLEVLATVRSWASVGVDPAETGLAPSLAIPLALDKAGLALGEVDLVEINEAFASMAVACSRRLGLPHDVVNVNGGAVALGHPVACSGARIVVTLLHELRRRGGGVGVASLCAGGGMGSATVVEVPAG
jgi:acetyl-CoA acetyltransferase family protein